MSGYGDLKKGPLAAAVYLWLTALFLPAQAYDTGVVTAVYDGDTLRVRMARGVSEKVRLIGVNAPELDHEKQWVRFQAEVSKRFAYYRLFRQKVRLSYDWEKRDKYGRVLAYIWTPEGMFNEIMLREGYAPVFLKYPFNKKFQKRFKKAEERARREKSGLWKDFPYPVLNSAQAVNHLGDMHAVQFVCRRITRRKNYALLKSRDGQFQAFIYREDLNRFPRLEYLRNKQLRVAGMIEDYRGQPQMVLFLPLQLNILSKGVKIIVSQ